MSKAFVRDDGEDTDRDGADASGAAPAAPGGKNYITRHGYERLKLELDQLIDVERPKVVEIVHWAASNGDRSENGDYLYGKKRLREIDRRIRFLTQRLGLAEIVEPAVHHGGDQVFFGATVTCLDDDGVTTQVTILGVDEIDSIPGAISWVSPLAKALIKARVGDAVQVQTPGGPRDLEVVSVSYPAPRAHN